ncbi:unnamed protein product [Brassicogethes aeneus]|uniref:Uncharacterized protein n=1 Tax=Brassicogethes aeneus TaxID=1431903 RepID=A0A9P0FM14_BRAAE|nr:unnamed protein product [Brassicogethes aeneus]
MLIYSLEIASNSLDTKDIGKCLWEYVATMALISATEVSEILIGNEFYCLLVILTTICITQMEVFEYELPNLSDANLSYEDLLVREAKSYLGWTLGWENVGCLEEDIDILEEEPLGDTNWKISINGLRNAEKQDIVKRLTYCSTWEESFIWLKGCSDPYFAYCTLCNTKFRIDGQGVSQVKSHQKGQKHENFEKMRSGNSRQSTFKVNSSNQQVELSSGNFVLTDAKQILKAEIIWCLKVCKNNSSFASNNENNVIFQLMFPDSNIAKNYNMSETKCKYVIEFEIAKFVKEMLIKDVKNSPYTFKFDETTTSQVKKQFDGYVQYFSTRHQKDLHFFFKLSSSRREDYKFATLHSEIESQFMLKHVNTRWLSLKKVLSRIIEQFANLKEYFLKFIPDQKNFAREVGSTDRYKRIKLKLTDQKTEAYLSFAIYIGDLMEAFEQKFQGEEPLVYALHTSINELFLKIMDKFVKKEKLDNSTLGQVNVENSNNQKSAFDIDLDFRTKQFLAKMEGNYLSSIKILRIEFKLCLVKIAKYLQEKLPWESKTLKQLTHLHPKFKLEKESVASIEALAKLLTEVLPNFHSVFGLPNRDVYKFIEQVKMEFRAFQHDTTEYNHSRLDVFWNEMKQKKDLVGANKYFLLSSVALTFLSLSHSNATAERGFSFNKFILENKLSLKENTETVYI